MEKTEIQTLSNLTTMEEKNEFFRTALYSRSPDKQALVIIVKALDTFKSSFDEEEKQKDYESLMKVVKQSDLLYLSLIRSTLKMFGENNFSLSDKKLFLSTIVDNAVKSGIITPKIDDLPSYKEEFSAMYMKNNSAKDDLKINEINEINEILNLKSALADPELNSVYEKTMLSYNLKREQLRKENKIK